MRMFTIWVYNKKIETYLTNPEEFMVSNRQGWLNFEICWKTASLVQNHSKIIKISNKKNSTK